jgi:hypothetical protein
MLRMALPPILLVLYSKLLELACDLLPNEAKLAEAFEIVGVAVFSFIILRKKFLLTQMLAVVFIAFGLTIFENNASLTLTRLTENSVHGYLLILAAVCCYGMCYSLLESNLKLNDVSLWIRGIQFNIFYVPISLFIVLNSNNSNRGFFDNFNLIAYFYIIFVTSCCMMQFFVIRIADGMSRIISLAVATVLINIMQHAFTFDTFSDSSLKVGCGLVIAGFFLYSIIDLANLKNDSSNEYSEAQSKHDCYQSVPTVSYKIKN